MKDQNNKLIHKLNICFLTFFGTGLAPKAPGTVGSIATIPLIYLLAHFHFSFLSVCLITLFIFASACLIADKVQRELGIFDPGWIVIDEVIGMLVTWLFIFPAYDWKNLLAVFIVFRIFDIIKIWPASYFDKQMKNGFATIFDDVISAVYAGLVVFTLNYFHLIN